MKTSIAQVIEYVNDTHWEQFNQTTNQGLIPIGLSLYKCIIKEITNSKLLVSAKFFYVPKIKVGFLAWNPTFFRYLCFYHKT